MTVSITVKLKAHMQWQQPPTATALEVARQLSLTEEPLKKSIQFVFWDNECDGLTSSDTNGSYNFSKTNNISVDLANSNWILLF